MFNIKYLVMHKVQVHNKTISYLVYGSCVCIGDNPLAKAVDYLPIQTDEPYTK